MKRKIGIVLVALLGLLAVQAFIGLLIPAPRAKAAAVTAFYTPVYRRPLVVRVLPSWVRRNAPSWVKSFGPLRRSMPSGSSKAFDQLDPVIRSYAIVQTAQLNGGLAVAYYGNWIRLRDAETPITGFVLRR